MINQYIIDKKKRDFKRDEITNFFFGVSFGSFIIILSFMGFIYVRHEVLEIIFFISFLFGCFIFLSAIFYPNILTFISKFCYFITNFIFKVIFSILFTLIYFIFVTPIGVIVRIKNKKNSTADSNYSTYSYNNNYINRNKNSLFYQIIHLFSFFYSEKYYIFMPLLLLLIILAIIVILTQSSFVAPFIYTLF